MEETIKKVIDQLEEYIWEDNNWGELSNIRDKLKEFIQAYKQLEKENIRLKYQDIPYLEGTIKGYKARIEELLEE